MAQTWRAHSWLIRFRLSKFAHVRRIAGLSVRSSVVEVRYCRRRPALADGEAGLWERLPLAKDIAAILGVNKNTVLRAMHILRDEGLLDFTRGRGITVAGRPQKSAVLRQVRELVAFARRQGYHREAVIG